MDCAAAENSITRYIQDEMSDEELEHFIRHVRSCSYCWDELSLYCSIAEGIRVLDSETDDFDIRNITERMVRASLQYLRFARLHHILFYAIDTLVLMSLGTMLLLLFRLLFL